MRWEGRRHKRSDNSGRSTTLLFCHHLLLGGQIGERRQHLHPANICLMLFEVEAEVEGGKEEAGGRLGLGSRRTAVVCDERCPDCHSVEATDKNTCRVSLCKV